MKRIFLYVVLAMTLASCTSDPNENDLTGDSGVGNNDVAASSVLTYLPADQSRITYGPGSVEAAAYAGASRFAITRTGETADETHPYLTQPSIPSNAVELTSNDVNNLGDRGGVWKISKGSDVKSFWISNIKASFEIYVEASDVNIGISSADSHFSTIYVMKEADNFKLNNGLAEGWTLKCWSNYSGDSFTMNPNTNFYYYGEKPLAFSFYIQDPKGTYYFESHAPVTFKNYMNINIGEYWFGQDVLFEQDLHIDSGRNPKIDIKGNVTVNGSTTVKDGDITIDGKAVFNGTFSTDNTIPNLTFKDETSFNKTAYIPRGKLLFEKKVVFEDLNIGGNNDTEFTFNECSYIHKCELYGNGNVSLNVNYFLILTDGFTTQKGCKVTFNLNDGVLVIGGESPAARVATGTEGFQEYDNGKNVFVENKYVYGKGNSAVFIQGSIYLYKDMVSKRDTEYVANCFKTVNTGDKLAVFGKRYTNGNNEVVTEDPVINVWIADQRYINQGANTPFADKGVLIGESLGQDAQFYIDALDPEDCRGDYTYNWTPEEFPEPEGPNTDGVEPPKHKFSATGLDFLDVTNEDGTTDTYIYVCWHSNRAQDVDENETDHSHGTNVGDNGEEPSLANKDDWGGIIDIVRLSTYNPTDVNAEGELYIESTIDQQDNEHKYNHVKFYDNKLYLATTSWLVGAALQIVPLDETHTHFDGNVRRVNLTGVSANCVEVVENSDLVTISGRSLGGINWFPLNETASQEKKQINDIIKNYGGKYVCIDGQYIYALHNTEAATITQYDFSGNKVDELVTKEQLRPYDGKNALQVRDGKVYICCGRNGLQVYDWASKKKVGKTKLAANCVDIDENGEYFYVATGGGLAKYKVDNVDENNYYVREKYVSYFGKGFIYPNGQTMGEGSKESSNFVKVHGDKIFVAYGMYGLRIYDAKDLTSKLNDDHRTVND